jgi:hypothetical protein
MYLTSQLGWQRRRRKNLEFSPALTSNASFAMLPRETSAISWHATAE